MALLGLAFLLVPLGSAQAAIPGCAGDPAPTPELTARDGSDGLLVPPQSDDSIARSPDGLPPDASVYGQYGVSGQQWHTIRESCVDKLSSSALVALSDTTWELSKTINQSTITVYQAATSDGLLNAFNTMVVSAVEGLREGLWRPLLPTVIILGAIWLGWYGLVRKRVTLTLESSIWMVLATALGIWILAQPAQVLNLAGSVVSSGSHLVNSSVSQVSAPGVAARCPAGASEPEKAEWETDSEFAVRSNSNMLWSGLVCRPWMAGQFGTGTVANTGAGEHAMPLMEAQGFSNIEQHQIQQEAATSEAEYQQLIVERMAEKQESYEEIASAIESEYPEIYPLFSGDQVESRLAIGSLALFAAIFAGGLILAGSVALIVLQIGFLILLLLAPIFLLIGVHPGFGRVVLLRWIEMILGLVLKQIFIALLISLLVLAYSMIMATHLSWGLQVILLSLFTLALFIYRKPFAHLFASVNANTFTSRMVSDAMTSSVLGKSATVLPPVAYFRAQKWGLRNAPKIGAIAAGIPAGGREGADGEGIGRPGLEAADTGAQESSRAEAGRSDAGRARGQAGYGRARGGAKPPPLPLGQNSGGGTGPPGAAGRSSAQAPRLSDLAAPASGAGGSSGGERIPPRPPGGYTGRGSSNWGDIFGASSGNAPRPADRPSAGSAGGGSSGAGSLFDSRGAAAPRTDDSVMRGRRPTPPQGNGGGGWRLGGARGRERPAPPPPRSRGAASPRHSGGDEGGTWFSGSKSGQADRPSTPFWAETGTRRRDVERDVPFWLRDDD